MRPFETFKQLSGKLFLGGSDLANATTVRQDVIEPATERLIGQIADATDAKVDAATDIAAQAGRVWNAIDMRSRAVILHKIASVIRADKMLCAEYLTRKEGKPLTGC